VNIGQIVDPAAAAAPSRVALVFGDHRCTYGELAGAVADAGSTLLSHGATPGARVPVVDVATLGSIAATLGAARLGGAAALMNPALRPRELAALIEISNCTPPAVAGEPYLDEVRQTGIADVISSRALRDDGGAHAAAPDPSHDDTRDALVLFTSGTTGLPKPIAISHQVLTARISAFAAPFSAERSPSVSLMCVPFFHVGGSLGLLGSLASGNTTVIQDRFDAGAWLGLIEQHQVVSSFVVPTMLQRILDHPDFAPTRLQSLVSIAYGAAAAPVPLIRRAMATLPHVAFANVFGQTETLGAYTTLLPGDHQRADRVGSIGRPLPGVRVRIVAPGTDDEVKAGEVGELLVLSPANVRPGWLRTGDLARADADGYLYPSGRLSDTINRAGEKFGPIEVETVLREHPSVADVAVAGFADAEMGQRVGAAVVTRHPVAGSDLKRHCLDHLARFKVPERIAFVDEIPYSNTGKVDRRALAQLLSEAGEPV